MRGEPAIAAVPVAMAATFSFVSTEALLAHPIIFAMLVALVAGSVRWALGDRTGGWRTWLIQIGASLFVVWLTSAVLAMREVPRIEHPVYQLFFAFVAKDVATIIIHLAQIVRENPMAAFDMIGRLREALRGGPSQPPGGSK